MRVASGRYELEAWANRRGAFDAPDCLLWRGIMNMGFEIKLKKLNKQETYACAPSAVRAVCARFDLYVSFGYFGRNYDLSRDVSNRPVLRGTVVAAASIPREPSFHADGYLQFFAVRGARYDETMRENFARQILPQIVQWIERMRRRTETARLGTEYFLAVLDDGAFRVYTYSGA